MFKVLFIKLFLVISIILVGFMADELFVKNNFENVYICQSCNASNRSASGRPSKCRKCNGKRLRLKKKRKKSG